MPLPAALLARLQKRGLVTKEVEKKNDEAEEVFAEDYDEQAHTDPVPASLQPEPVTYLMFESVDCPNKKFKPDEAMEKRRLRMLNKYPLPVGWHEVADPDTGRFYYWNEDTDKVCWLSPTHPKARITMAALKMQELMKGKENTSSAPPKKRSKFSDAHDHVPEEPEERREKKKSRRDRRKDRDDALDPMDPASYSDISRGSWSSGLERSGDAKTGVDVTASGPLFQQRPYPAPGAILRAQKPPDKE